MPEQNNDNKGLLDFLNCNSHNWGGCFIRKCLDTSITGKLLGMLVVSLLGFTVVCVLHNIALHNIKIRNHEIKEVSIPQYKVSQFILRSINGFKISLLHILNEPELNVDNKNILANQQRLKELERMLIALKKGGALLDVAKSSQKTLDVINLIPSTNPQVLAQIESIDEEFVELSENFQLLIKAFTQPGAQTTRDETLGDVIGNLNELHEQLTTLALLTNTLYNKNLKETEEIINSSQQQSILISLIIAVILTLGTILYIMLIVAPLRDILEKIKFIAKGEGDLSHGIEVRTDDEVGLLARQLNTLVDNIFSLNSFKAVIEEEETTTDVNLRLANLLRERYGFDKLFVYEVTGNKNNMSIAYCSSNKEVCSTDILDDSNFCRAKRTGHPISSFQFPEICKKFPYADKFEHHCIPMIANGRAVGIVQFLHEKNRPASELESFETRVKRASRYIKEATPVIEAKRFASALQETTLKDPMTDLYNRRFLETYSDNLVASTLRRGSKVGILMCDMDFFKEVNDNYGHESGDIVLIKTAEILQHCVRTADIVIRYGGEEFLVLLTDVHSNEDIAELAERIRSIMESTAIKLPEGSLKKTISIGYSLFPDDTDAFWEAIKYADVALYRAKETGRNRVVGFDKEMWDQEKY
ncbi:MAG: GGDEF domain-containing protein [Desulfobulbaceae bacterium]|nr:GGDEF domain-containing protein [Desulfobulbaceae bacterium]HIJ78305.1 sensor domain-containing diguanylate cyclase [Deltaproteobacteria bacterium]